MIRSTNFLIPPVRKSLVARPQLKRKLEEGMETKLTLLSAQAGYGKTTALSEWARQSDCPVAWISLDKYSNDWSAFWGCVLASIRESLPQFGQAIEFILEQESASSIDSSISAFINELNSMEGDLVLILDDYHVIDCAPVHESIRYLLAHMHPHIHLYMASRNELPFPTARLLAKGEMTVIRVDDMRFELEEGVAFFRETTDLSLTEKQVTELFQQTEGWVSGFQLAAISLKRSGNMAETIRQFNGKQRHISDYMLEEVFVHLSESLREFLLATSVLGRLNWEICMAVTEKADSQEQLEQLEQLNLFIVPLDDQRNWFRYHHLLSDFLQQLSAREYTSLWRRSHYRAAKWHENQRLYEEAVEHYIKAQEIADAVRLIDRIMPEFMQSKGGVLAKWITALPESSYEHLPAFELFYISNLLLEGQWSQGLERAKQAEKRFEAMRAFIPEPEWSQLMGNIYYLCGIFAYLHQDLPLTSTYFELSEQHSPEGSGFQRSSNNRYLGHEGFMDLLSLTRNLREVERFLLKWLKTWENRPNYSYVGYIYLSYSLLLYEWNRLEEAQLYLRQAMSREDVRANVWIWIHLGMTSAWVRLASGMESQAIEWLGEFSSNVNSPDRHIIGKRIMAEQALLLLSQGKPEQAYAWLEPSGLSHMDEVTSRTFEEYLIMVRILAANNRVEEAQHLLGKLEHIADEENRLRGRIRLKIVQSMVLRQSPRPEEALAPLGIALRLSEQAGYIRSFLDEGPLMVAMLRELALDQQQAMNPVVAPLPYIRKLLEAADGDHSCGSHSNKALTEQEAKVLAYLGEGMMYKEIASRLNITLDTVKFHMKNIYRKLGVSNRVQAIERAKRHQ